MPGGHTLGYASWTLASISTVGALLMEKMRMGIDLRQALTPLRAAAANGHDQAVRILLEGKAEVDARTKVPCAMPCA